MESTDTAEDEAAELTESVCTLFVTTVQGDTKTYRVEFQEEYTRGDLEMEIEDGFTQNSFFQFPMHDGSTLYLNVQHVSRIGAVYS